MFSVVCSSWYRILVVIVSLFWLSRNCAQAVVINEIFPNPEGSREADEWIELYNGDGDAVELNGWVLDDAEGGSTPYVIDNLTIEGNSFAVIEQSLSGLKLNNSGDEVRLMSPDTSVVDRVSYGEDVYETASYGRQPDGSDNWKIFDNPTKAASNSVSEVSNTVASSPAPMELPVATNLRLSEFRACPLSGEPEWVEVASSENQTVSTRGWVIEDAAGTRKQIETQIGVGGYGVQEWYSSVLNNSGDSVKLLNPEMVMVDSYTYTECDRDASWVRNNGHWQQTMAITKGYKNEIIHYSPTSKPSQTSSGGKNKKSRLVETENNADLVPKNDDSVMVSDISEVIIDDSWISTESASIAGIIDTSTQSGTGQAMVERLANSTKGSVVPYMVVGGVMLIAAGGVPLMRNIQKRDN